MKISIIVAQTENRVIGKNNDIPWYLPADLKYFKKVTTGHHIIMGRKCYESIGRPLPKRTNVILTRRIDFHAEGCVVTHSLDEALDIARQNGEAEAFIIGGGEIYKLAMPLVDQIYLTQVHTELEGDIYFPELDPEKWQLEWSEAHQADEKNGFDYTFQRFIRMENGES
ncbi:MAG: dihydrofolate reductase [Bacteroidota bacterium]